MKSAAISEVKNRLSHYLRIVSRGETVTILDRGRPVAQLTPLRPEDEEISELAAAGLARLPQDPLPADFFRRPLPKARDSVVKALIAEREDRL